MTREERQEWAERLRRINKTDLSVAMYRASMVRTVEALADRLVDEGEWNSLDRDWERLRAGEIRALTPEYQDVFDAYAALRAEADRLRTVLSGVERHGRELQLAAMGLLEQVTRTVLIAQGVTDDEARVLVQSVLGGSQ